MGIIKQTAICIIIGFLFMACDVSENKTIEHISDKTKAIILEDYTITEIKETCLNSIDNAREFKDRTKKAIEYTQETMASYRKNVI